MLNININSKAITEPKKTSKITTEVKMKLAKYLTLVNISALGFATTKDVALMELLTVYKGVTIKYLTADVLVMSGVFNWQLLLFIATLSPVVVLNQRDKKSRR